MTQRLTPFDPDAANPSAREAAHQRLARLTALGTALNAMAAEELRLISTGVGIDRRHDRVNAAFHNAAYDVFGCDELYAIMLEIEPQPAQPTRYEGGRRVAL